MADSVLPLTFGQRFGFEPLPSQMALTEVTPHLRSSMWATIRASLQYHSQDYSGSWGKYLKQRWTHILKDYWIDLLHNNIDEFSNDFDKSSEWVKMIIVNLDHLTFFNFLQHVIGHPACPDELPAEINQSLSKTRSPYRVTDKMLVAVSSTEQADAVIKALQVAKSSPAEGPYSHLREASAFLNAGQWAASVRESISAVEGAAKSVEPSADTLGKALSKLKNSVGLNEAMASAFKQLYGYTSDQQGIRHAQVFSNQTNVTERDALFMFGACASFVAYLLSSVSLK